MPCAPSAVVPTSTGTAGPQHCSPAAASDSRPQAGQKVPEAELRVHNIPGGANFKEQLKRRQGKKNPQPKTAPVCTLEEHKGRKGRMTEQGLSISLARGVPTFNLRWPISNLRWGLTCSMTGPDITGKTSCSPISPPTTETRGCKYLPPYKDTSVPPCHPPDAVMVAKAEGWV